MPFDSRKLEQLRAGLPVVEGVVLAVQLDLELDRPLRAAAAAASSAASSSSVSAAVDLAPAADLDLREVAERVAAQRDELLLVPARPRELQLRSASTVAFMNGAGPQHERVVRRVRRRERLAAAPGSGSPWTDSSQCTTSSRSGCSAASSASASAKITELLVAVGVEQHDPPAALAQRRAGDRHDRRDARPAGEQQQVGVEVGRREDPARRQHPQRVARPEVVDDPVRGVAVDGPLDRDRRRAVLDRAAAQRVAARGDAGLVARHGDGEELAGLVGEVLGRVRRGPRSEIERASPVSSTTSRTFSSKDSVSIFGPDRDLAVAYGGLDAGRPAAGTRRAPRRPPGSVDIRANSWQSASASVVHWIEVWCSLFFFTPTRARQSRQATSTSRALV